MLTRNNILDYLKENKGYFEREFKVSKLGIFGSFARNEMNEKSDIDILIDFEKGTKNMFFNKEEIREIISNTFDRNVDVCYPDYLNKYFKNDILEDAIYV